MVYTGKYIYWMVQTSLDDFLSSIKLLLIFLIDLFQWGTYQNHTLNYTNRQCTFLLLCTHSELDSLFCLFALWPTWPCSHWVWLNTDSLYTLNHRNIGRGQFNFDEKILRKKTFWFCCWNVKIIVSIFVRNFLKIIRRIKIDLGQVLSYHFWQYR